MPAVLLCLGRRLRLHCCPYLPLARVHSRGWHFPSRLLSACYRPAVSSVFSSGSGILLCRAAARPSWLPALGFQFRFWRLCVRVPVYCLLFLPCLLPAGLFLPLLCCPCACCTWAPSCLLAFLALMLSLAPPVTRAGCAFLSSAPACLLHPNKQNSAMFSYI